MVHDHRRARKIARRTLFAMTAQTTRIRKRGIEALAMPSRFGGTSAGCEVPELSVVRVSITCSPADASQGNSIAHPSISARDWEQGSSAGLKPRAPSGAVIPIRLRGHRYAAPQHTRRASLQPGLQASQLFAALQRDNWPGIAKGDLEQPAHGSRVELAAASR